MGEARLGWHKQLLEGDVMRRILGVSAAALLLASCGGPDAEGTIETEDGDVTYSVDGDGDEVNIDMTGPDGEEVSIRSGDGASSDLPDGFSVYPGATVVTSANIDTSDGQGSVVVLSTDASLDEVVTFYRGQAEAAGVDIQSEMTVNGMRIIGGEGPDGLTFGATASPGEDGATTVQLTIGRGL
jgi:hypothetical protein